MGNSDSFPKRLHLLYTFLKATEPIQNCRVKQIDNVHIRHFLKRHCVFLFCLFLIFIKAHCRAPSTTLQVRKSVWY